jgi:hypothetical protein
MFIMPHRWPGLLQIARISDSKQQTFLGLRCDREARRPVNRATVLLSLLICTCQNKDPDAPEWIVVQMSALDYSSIHD